MTDATRIIQTIAKTIITLNDEDQIVIEQHDSMRGDTGIVVIPIMHLAAFMDYIWELVDPEKAKT